jgi:hypothetical protein
MDLCSDCVNFVLGQFNASFRPIEHPSQKFLLCCPQAIALLELFDGYGVLSGMTGDRWRWEDRMNPL